MSIMIKCQKCRNEIKYPFQGTKEQFERSSFTVVDIGIPCPNCKSIINGNSENCFWED